MLPTLSRPIRLQRLLTYLEHDPQNSALRKDAVREAFARCLHHVGRREEAESACRACLAAQPVDAGADGLLALLLYESGRRTGKTAGMVYH